MRHLLHDKTPPHLLSARRWDGMRIGLLGGSFNPPHHGHMHIAKSALRRHKLHAVWWMVSPQNPLKSKNDNFQKRFRMTRRYVAPHPKMIATDIEQKMNIRYSYETIQKLKKRFPKTKFVWIAGMDNALVFHKWDKWRDLLRSIPFVFFNRPPNMMTLSSNVIRMYRGQKNVKWSIHGKTRNISSTALRNKTIAKYLKNKIYSIYKERN